MMTMTIGYPGKKSAEEVRKKMKKNKPQETNNSDNDH
jgi:hypothetical protein